MLIGIVGKARSGKDTVANFLVAEFNFAKLSFADPLKAIIMELFDMSHEQLYGDLKEVVDKRYAQTPRWLLQYIGTNVFRKLHENIWVNAGIRQCEKTLANQNVAGIVISDVRFQNEFSAIKEAGGQLWKVLRIDHEWVSGGIENHVSEIALDNLPDNAFSSILSACSGELDKLYDQARQEISRVFNRSQR